MNAELLARHTKTILTGICWHPEQSSFSWDPQPGRLHIRFEPDPRDLRFCIGENGRCIKGLQHVVAVIGKLNGYRATISLQEQFKDGPVREEHEFEQHIGFDDREIISVTSGLLASAFARETRLRHKRSNDLLELKTEARTDGEQVIINALNEPLYAYGYRQGCLIKLSATHNGK